MVGVGVVIVGGWGLFVMLFGLVGVIGGYWCRINIIACPACTSQIGVNLDLNQGAQDKVAAQETVQNTVQAVPSTEPYRA